MSPNENRDASASGNEGTNTRTAGRTRAVLATVLTAAFMTQAGVTAVNVAVPAIQREFAVGGAVMQWILAGYTLPFALLLITGGRLGDILGRRRAFLAGVVGFTLASLLAALRPGPRHAAGARVLQGASAAVAGPQVLAVLRSAVPRERRGAALGAYAAVIGLATVGGPVLGGVLVQFAPFDLGWRAVLAVNVPLGLLVALGGLRLPEARSRGGAGLDPPGVLLGGTALLLLLYPLVGGAQAGWPWHMWVMLAASVPAVVLFAVAERRRERAGGLPLVPTGLFGNRVFTAGLLVTAVTAALVGGFFLVFVVFLQNGAGLSSGATGLLVCPWALGTAAVSGPAIRWARGHGRRVLMAGAVVMTGGMAVLAAVVRTGQTDPPPLLVAPVLLVVGVGMGLVSAPIMDVVLAVLPEADAGAAAGVFTTFKQVGAAFGVAAVGAAFFAVLGGPDGPPSAHVAAMTAVVACEIAGCLLVWALLFLMPAREPVRVPSGADTPRK
ncbi:MFS transporter [Nocardiopsis sp. CNR-923]|uniref:MFS transporter n=1 Tax=Nocardiopsis sp. CNR-923 TaxID=1904965 RepID=UPI00117DCCA8|nr:MFS transporter [Nocardiopsis sp. CNR-923]